MSTNIWRVRISDAGAGIYNNTYQLIEQETEPTSPHTFASPINASYAINITHTTLIKEKIKTASISESIPDTGVTIEGIVFKNNGMYKNGVKIVFGENYHKQEKDTTSEPVDTTLSLNISPHISIYDELTTAVVPAGMYKINVQVTMLQSSHLGYAEAQILFDNVSVTPQPHSFSPSSDAIAQTQNVNLSAFVTTVSDASHSVKLQVGRGTVNGVVCIFASSIEFYRIS